MKQERSPNMRTFWPVLLAVIGLLALSGCQTVSQLITASPSPTPPASLADFSPPPSTTPAVATSTPSAAPSAVPSSSTESLSPTEPPTATPETLPAAPADVSQTHVVTQQNCVFTLPCIRVTVSWAAPVDPQTRVEVFEVSSDPHGESGQVVADCAAALTILNSELQRLHGSKIQPDNNPSLYAFDIYRASSSMGATSVSFKWVAPTDYQGKPCAFYVRATNAIGASPLELVPGGIP